MISSSQQPNAWMSCVDSGPILMSGPKFQPCRPSLRITIIRRRGPCLQQTLDRHSTNSKAVAAILHNAAVWSAANARSPGGCSQLSFDSSARGVPSAKLGSPDSILSLSSVLASSNPVLSFTFCSGSDLVWFSGFCLFADGSTILR